MAEIVRFSVSLEADLLEQFDLFCAESRFATRSEAIRQLLREKLTAKAVADDSTEVAASLTLVYDQHRALPAVSRLARSGGAIGFRLGHCRRVAPGKIVLRDHHEGVGSMKPAFPHGIQFPWPP